MRYLTRTATVLARLAACGEGSAVRATLKAVGSMQQSAIAEGFGGIQPCSSSSSSSRAWARHRGFASAAEPARSAPDTPGLNISDSAVERLKELGPNVVLRIMVEGGGCSGFQYEFSLDEAAKDGDRLFQRDGVTVVCDDLSLEFLRGATVNYESDLMRSAFVVDNNPNAASSCGCGSSFVAK